ncbi:MAG: protein kinase [Acidobacteriota bacterium]
MPDVIANRYRIDRPLEAGAAAFQAFDLQLSRAVVVKILPVHRLREAHFARQIYQEAVAAARLAHPNLVGVYDVVENGAHALGGRAEPDPFMVLEWVPGRDLRAYLASREPLPSEDLTDPFGRKLDLMIQVCRGLHYGHEQGLTHGSVNPENIRVTAAGEVKILNFGITPFRQNPPVNHLSPEQLQGQAKPDRTSDVFSLGVVLYQLLFGIHPFAGEREEATRSRILRGEYTPIESLLPGSSGQLIEIVSRTVSRCPGDRFRDCKLLESELKALRSRLAEEKEECRARLVSLRAALKKDARSHNPGQVRLFDLAVLESADPSSADYEHLLRSCNELAVVIDRLRAQAHIEKVLDSAESQAISGELEAALASVGDVLRNDPGNTRARALEAVIRRRREVASLLEEARQAEAASDVAMGCLLALQAAQLDPGAADAKAEFERMQALLRQRGGHQPARTVSSELQPGKGAGRSCVGLNPRFLARVASVFGILLVLVGVWLALSREGSGPAPVSARNAAVRDRSQAPRQATVSLDVVPWAKVDSIVDLKDGKSVRHEALESPCTFRLPAGRYAITVSHPEFGSRLLRVDVRDGVTNRVNATLLSEPQLEKEVHRVPR